MRGLFTRIARRYDRANALLSGGLDAWWRARAARIVRGWQPSRLLDLATGSGVLAAALSRACPATEVTGADFCPPMLAEARQRRGLARLVAADALRLPFRDATFDAVTVAFGLRNMASWEGALAEMRRVLRPSGHLLVLDFSLPSRSWLRRPYRWYLHHVLPRWAGWITGERPAYDYLAESIEAFPSGGAMRRLIEGAGLTEATSQELTGGIVSLYTAGK